jgi:hypothetical protein
MLILFVNCAVSTQIYNINYSQIDESCNFFFLSLETVCNNLHIRSTHTNTQIFAYLPPPLSPSSSKTITLTNPTVFSTATAYEAYPTANGLTSAF